MAGRECHIGPCTRRRFHILPAHAHSSGLIGSESGSPGFLLRFNVGITIVASFVLCMS